MNTIMKTAIGAVMLGGAALASTAPANAAVVGVTIGVPGVAVGYYGNPCYRPYAWRPAYCYAPVYGGYYGASWYAPYRVYGGRDYAVRGRFDRDDFVRDRNDSRNRDGRFNDENRDVR
jgi:hypothetical protein